MSERWESEKGHKKMLIVVDWFGFNVNDLMFSENTDLEGVIIPLIVKVEFGKIFVNFIITFLMFNISISKILTNLGEILTNFW